MTYTTIEKMYNFLRHNIMNNIQQQPYISPPYPPISSNNKLYIFGGVMIIFVVIVIAFLFFYTHASSTVMVNANPTNNVLNQIGQTSITGTPQQ